MVIQLTQVTFIKAANCDKLTDTQTIGIKGGRGHLCDITVSLTDPSGRAWEVKALTLGDGEFTVVSSHERRTHINSLLLYSSDEKKKKNQTTKLK